MTLTRGGPPNGGTSIALDTDARLKSCHTAIRSELVAESNRMEGYDTQTNDVKAAAMLYADQPVSAFLDHIRDDIRLVEGLGLYKAYELADEWAAAKLRPRQDEIRALHQLITPRLSSAGAYKQSDNEIGGSDHVTIPPWDVQEHMTSLSSWFAQGSGDAILDAAVVHAWLTHIHPFDDGNGRMARLLANLALVQSGFPPLLLRSVTDRNVYLDALAASDDGDLLPLYDLFHQALRRRLCELEKPGYVDKKIRAELFASARDRYRLWREEIKNLKTSLEIRARQNHWRIHYMGIPSIEDFSALENRDESGNCWFVKFRESETQRDRWLLWFGYQSQSMNDLLNIRPTDRPWPSIFFSKRSRDPVSVHPWEPVTESHDPNWIDELSIAPARRNIVTVRSGYKTRDVDIADASGLIIDMLSRIEDV